MKVLIKPRLQKDKWSVYWKTSMATRTLSLDSFELDVDPAVVTGKQLRATVAEAIGLQPEKTLCRLEGFVEPWELACVPRFPRLCSSRDALASRVPRTRAPPPRGTPHCLRFVVPREKDATVRLPRRADAAK
jgi:hypothetical protein